MEKKNSQESKQAFHNKYLFLTSFLLRAGLALVFLYAAVSAFLTPEAWSGFIPQFIKAIIPGSVFLTIYGAYEILLALWLISNKKTYYAALLSALTLFFIVILNATALDIVFRDIAILLAALALSALSYRRR